MKSFITLFAGLVLATAAAAQDTKVAIRISPWDGLGPPTPPHEDGRGGLTAGAGSALAEPPR